MVFSVLCSKFLSRNIVYFANMGRHILRLCQPLVWLSKYSLVFIFSTIG